MRFDRWYAQDFRQDQLLPLWLPTIYLTNERGVLGVSSFIATQISTVYGVRVILP